MFKSYQPKKILVHSILGIGDLVLFSPFLLAIRERFPKAEIHIIVGRNSSKEFLSKCPYIFKVIVLNKERMSFQDKIISAIRLFGEKYDMSIASAHVDTRINPILALISHARIRIGPSSNKFSTLYTYPVAINGTIHLVDRNFKMFHELGWHVKEDFELWISREDERYIDEFLQKQRLFPQSPLIAFTSGSGTKWGDMKRWPINNYVELAKVLKEKYQMDTTFIGGHKEKLIINNHLKDLLFPGINVAGKLTLHQSIALLKRCDLLVCNDTGFMHIASALRIPVIALFGPTDERVNGPYSGNNIVISRQTDCAPCYKGSWKINCDKNLCMENISVEKVELAIRKILLLKDVS